ncbi:hypothetical protein M011DRAFT_242729 [Sporormia fimetaria CBS 119925]|uniref:C2H2-type domain-containing protein n=1 Tax=Sporormia fimetaria CBS 119925 TaxID=1340428 RepID=A0A6A6VMI5_9PLEO|nr:hypothetical protein M011DRAFT_242729 [Sporormia fimetaria CBS 119925]
MTPHIDSWQRQPEEAIYIPDMHPSTVQPFIDTSKDMANMTGNMHLAYAMQFSGLPSTVSPSYHSKTFAIDPMSINVYNLQQSPFAAGYLVNMPSTLNFPAQAAPVPLVQAAERSRLRTVTPPVKTEANSPIQPGGSIPLSPADHCSQTAVEPVSQATFSTHVDVLMKAIQAKRTSGQEKRGAQSEEADDEGDLKNGPKKKYVCTVPGCDVSCKQKTHLVIHSRKHTGVKPYPCKHPGCGKWFSQLGNVKTHERSHTGEKPYRCSMCDKAFAQRGNLRQHIDTHKGKKPFVCKLGNCRNLGKEFTQLGNLKHHQNKFHKDIILDLTQKFSSIRAGDAVSEEDRRHWEYFASLYKHSNKGIKGRGSDKKRAMRCSPSVTGGSGPFAITPASPLVYHTESSQASGSDRSTRSSSLASDAVYYDFNTRAPTFSNHATYGEYAFPERRLF